MQSHRDLEIFNLSYELAVRVHKMSLQLPRYELYEEGSQLRRSAKGISACIAEGYGRRRYKAEFVKYLVYAHASCDETIVHLKFIQDTQEDINRREIQDLYDAYDVLGAKINRFLQFVEEEWNNPKPPTRTP